MNKDIELYLDNYIYKTERPSGTDVETKDKLVTFEWAITNDFESTLVRADSENFFFRIEESGFLLRIVDEGNSYGCEIYRLFNVQDDYADGMLVGLYASSERFKKILDITETLLEDIGKKDPMKILKD